MKSILIILGIIFIIIFLLFIECSLILAKREDEYMDNLFMNKRDINN